MGSGVYSEYLHVKHSDGNIYAYYVHANPLGDDAVFFLKRFIYAGTTNNVIEMVGRAPTGSRTRSRNLMAEDVQPGGRPPTGSEVEHIRQKLDAERNLFPTRDEMADAGTCPRPKLFYNILSQKSFNPSPKYCGTGAGHPRVTKVPRSGYGEDRGWYNEPLYVRHHDGLVFRYYVHCNPARDGLVFFERQLLLDGHPTTHVEICGMDHCPGAEVLAGEEARSNIETGNYPALGLYRARRRSGMAFPNPYEEHVYYRTSPGDYKTAMLGGGHRAPRYTGSPGRRPGRSAWDTPWYNQ